MSLSTQTLKRLPKIKAGLFTGLNYTQIGTNCGVTEKTIDRDIKTWIESGQFETWIKEEWVRLHNLILHDNPTEAYRQISKIIARMVTRKAELKTTEEIKVEEKHVTIVADYTRAVEEAVNADIGALRARKQVDTISPASDNE